MRRAFLFAFVAGCVFVAGWRMAPTMAASVQYPAGWNLVSGPDGSQLVGASGSLYTLQPGDSTYEAFPAASTLRGGWGYWAYFPSGGSLTAGAGNASYSVTPGAGSYVMIGDPSADGAATVTGAVQLLTYDPATGYHSSSTIAAGQGAFLLAGGAVSLSATVAPAAAAPAATTTAAATPPATATATPSQALPSALSSSDGLAALGLQDADLPSGFMPFIAVFGDTKLPYTSAYLEYWLNLSPQATDVGLFDETMLSFNGVHPRLADFASALLSDERASGPVSLPVDSIGDEDVLYYSTISLRPPNNPNGPATTLYAYSLFFRRGPVLIEIETGEFQPNGSVSFLESLARTVVARLAAGGVPSTP